MTATITVKEKTKKRLDSFKTCEMTDDDLLNYLMDTISMEEATEDDIKKHYERLETFNPVPKDDFIKLIRSLKNREGMIDLW